MHGPAADEPVPLPENAAANIDLVKPQQLRRNGSPPADATAPGARIPIVLPLGSEPQEVVLLFDQPEWISHVAVTPTNALWSSLDTIVEYCPSFGGHRPLPHTVEEDRGTGRTILRPPAEWKAWTMELRLRLGSAVAAIPADASVRFEIFVHDRAFSLRMAEFDRAGILAAVSADTAGRGEGFFETRAISNGDIIRRLESRRSSVAPGGIPGRLFPGAAAVAANLLGEPVGPGSSMMVPLMNRNGNVSDNLANWLEQGFDELILLDWSSNEPVSTVPGVLDDPRVRIVRVEDQTRFIRTIGQNIAVRMARHDKVLKCDSDVRLRGDFLAAHPLHVGEYWAGEWRQARDPNERHLNGDIYCCRADFERVNGYDERLLSYGHEDTDLKDRLLLAGLVKRAFDFNCLHHVPHSTEMRTTHQPMIHPMVKVFENRLLSNRRELWSPRCRGTNVDGLVVRNVSGDGRIVTLALSAPPFADDDRSEEDRAIDIVAASCGPRETVARMTRDEKIALIWEKKND